MSTWKHKDTIQSQVNERLHAFVVEEPGGEGGKRKSCPMGDQSLPKFGDVILLMWVDTMHNKVKFSKNTKTTMTTINKKKGSRVHSHFNLFFKRDTFDL